MPQLGFGTYKFKKQSGDAYRAVKDALQEGYRHFDTAFVYGGEQTEKEVGEALKSIPRSEVFLTTKQWRNYFGYTETLDCLDQSLNKLQMEYVDLYLIHWPTPSSSSTEKYSSEIDVEYLHSETWRAMEDAMFAGKCRSIGVANFSIQQLESLRLFTTAKRIWPPAVNQIELHPYNPQTELVKYCEEHGIHVQAYASLGGQDSNKKTWNKLGGKLTERNEVVSIAKKHDKTPSQVLLRWATQRGYSVIPKSKNIVHIKENFQAVSESTWHLDEEDTLAIATLDQSTNGEENIYLCWTREKKRD